MIEKRHIIPEESILKHREKVYNYIDSFHAVLSSESEDITLKDFTLLFISSGPQWGDMLMRVRDRIVRVFGLKTTDKSAEKEPQSITLEVGKQIGVFELLEKSDNEIVVGGNDKHLNLKVSLYIEPFVKEMPNRKLIITTCVEFNNLFGRLYFIPVKPIHKLIVRGTLKNIIENIEMKNKNSR